MNDLLPGLFPPTPDQIIEARLAARMEHAEAELRAICPPGLPWAKVKEELEARKHRNIQGVAIFLPGRLADEIRAGKWPKS